MSEDLTELKLLGGHIRVLKHRCNIEIDDNSEVIETSHFIKCRVVKVKQQRLNF